MSRDSTTVITYRCDGCGATIDEAHAKMNAGWTRFECSIATLSGRDPNHKHVDLCATCTDRIVIPGVREG